MQGLFYGGGRCLSKTSAIMVGRRQKILLILQYRSLILQYNFAKKASLILRPLTHWIYSSNTTKKLAHFTKLFF